MPNSTQGFIAEEVKENRSLVPASLPFRRMHCSREETRLLIVEKADELFHKFGFDRTPVSDIAASLGMSSANVYKFFPSKKALIEACADLSLSKLRKILLQVSQSPENAINRIEAVILSIYQFNRKQHKNDYEFYRLILQVYREEWACVREFQELQTRIIQNIIDDGVRLTEFEVADSLITAKIILDSVTWIINPVLFYELREQDVESRLHVQIQFLSRSLKGAFAA